MIAALLACGCFAQEPIWDGDTLTLTSVYLYMGWDDDELAAGGEWQEIPLAPELEPIETLLEPLPRLK